VTLAAHRTRHNQLAPQLLRRRQPLSGGEIQVSRWLAEAGIRADHERWFYPFWIDPNGNEHGFRLDFTFTFDGIRMGIEVCEAGRYPTIETLPAGANRSKWRPPAVKLADKHAKCERLWQIHRVPCTVITEVEIDTWLELGRGARQTALAHHLRAAIKDRYQPLAG
jgi:hypothetical protein